MKKIVIIIIIIFIVVIGFIVFSKISNNEIIQTENVAENTDTLSNEENLSIAEITEIDNQEKWQWQHDTPENHNIDISVLNSVHNTIDSYPINAEVIVKDGYIVDEYYKEGYDQNSVFTLQSTSKSVTSAILGIAIDKGYIEGVNIPISTYFPQILESGSDYKNQITYTYDRHRC